MVRFSEVILPTVAFGHKYEINILYNIHTFVTQCDLSNKAARFIITLPLKAM